MSNSEGPSFLCEFCGAKVDKWAIKCNSCGHLFDSIKCPSCSYVGKAEDFPNGCPQCGFESSQLEEMREKIMNLQAQEASGGQKSKGTGGGKGKKGSGGKFSYSFSGSYPKKKKPDASEPRLSKRAYLVISVLLAIGIGVLLFLLHLMLREV